MLSVRPSDVDRVAENGVGGWRSGMADGGRDAEERGHLRLVESKGTKFLRDLSLSSTSDPL